MYYELPKHLLKSENNKEIPNQKLLGMAQFSVPFPQILTNYTKGLDGIIYISVYIAIRLQFYLSDSYLK